MAGLYDARGKPVGAEALISLSPFHRATLALHAWRAWYSQTP
jgi:hypothetical protein